MIPVRELRSHMYGKKNPKNIKKKKKTTKTNRSNIITNSIKTRKTFFF